MIINENKRVYQSQCLTLHKQFEQKLHLMGKTTTDESNDESVVGLQGRKLLSIAEKNDLQDSSHSDLKGNLLCHRRASVHDVQSNDLESGPCVGEWD